MANDVHNDKKLGQNQETIFTVTANCQDCYRCVRVCPVKAIRVHEGQASIEEELCIKCGTCVRECPQNAKTIRGSLDLVKGFIISDQKIAASVAPSFATVFNGWRSTRFPAALRRLGFGYVSETAEGAKLITGESLKSSPDGTIGSSCPAVVNYLEKYRPEFLDMLIPVVSPMVAHGRMLKNRLGSDWKVVFIGPCAAKKDEALRPENLDAIDAVLTFAELKQWLAEEGIELATCSESSFESYGNLNAARLFPLQGGMLKTGDLACDSATPNIIHVSGPEDILNLFDMPIKEWKYSMVEPLFCSGGCINGPCISIDKNIFTRKQDIIEYAGRSLGLQAANAEKDLNKDLERDLERDVKKDVTLMASFSANAGRIISEDIDENKINKILESSGKSNPELQLNCGACGYKTCRDNAIAVMRGMAEPEMCIPYTRRLALQRTDKIIETIPDGIVVLDSDLNIIKMNPAFHKMFMCNNGLLGRRISYLVDSVGFEKLAVGSVEQYESIQRKYGIKYHELLYALRGEKQYVGIYTDISKIKFDAGQIDIIKYQSLKHAKELLDHQIKFSQEMAHFLGSSTAQSEELLKRLMDLYEEE